MIRNVQDLSYQSGYFGTGLTQSAFQGQPNLEGFDATVIDNRAAASTAYKVGNLFIEQFLAANSGDANYTVSAAAAAPYPMFSYGVITSIPNAASPVVGSPPTLVAPGVTTGGGNEIRLRQKGTTLAYCTTSGTPIAVGSPLAADGAGNLTVTASTTPGVVLAISKGALGTGQAATLVLVNVGGY